MVLPFPMADRMNVVVLRRLLIPLSLLFIATSPAVRSSDDPEPLRLNVDGMHCQSCVSMIRKTVRKIPGVESVAVDLDKGLVEVRGDTTVARRAVIAEAIERMGYDVTEPDSVNGMKADSTRH